MLQGELSAILLTFIKLPFGIKIFVLSSFEWPFYTCFTVVIDKLSKLCIHAVVKMLIHVSSFLLCISLIFLQKAIQ